jgi:acylphosphatase
VNGWVRNRRDGTVEAMIQEDQEAVDKLIAWSQHGPRLAGVTKVDSQIAEGNFSSFEILPSV